MLDERALPVADGTDDHRAHRRGYLELDPGIEPYLITGWTEDLMGVLQTCGAPAGFTPKLRENFTHALVTTPAMIAFVNCVVAGVLAGLVFAQLGASMELSAIGAAGAFVAAFALFAIYGGRRSLEFWRSGGASSDED